MVMHARKTQRMNDGYFEKHQAHPYQNSKYSSSKSYGSSSDRYESRIRDSPNGNYRSDSPDSQSPNNSSSRDTRSYQSSKNSYLQKIREKERENRDYKMSRDKYSDCARSPKDKRSRDSEHRTNNSDDKGILHPIKVTPNLSSRDRKPMHNCIDKRDDRDRVARVGDWSEHVSSSGKKYYYNCKTEVSQWEKPREWIDRERDRFRNRDRGSERDSDRCYSSSSRSSLSRHDKHSLSRASSSGGGKETLSRHWCSGGSSRDDGDIAPPPICNHHLKETRGASTTTATINRKHGGDNEISQDMDISPGDSTPTSEVSYGGTRHHHHRSTSDGPNGPVLLANALPKLISHPPPESPPTTIGLTANAPGPPLSTSLLGVSGEKNFSNSNSGGASVTLTVDTSNHAVTVEGPPTPTHSETPDCVKAVAVPVTSPPGGGGTAGGVNSLPSSLQGMSVSLQALRPQGPTITPSLANHYRDDLVNHVRGWPAEIVEKQAQKLAEEAHIMGSIQCAKVSAELKSARSIVRLTEIQATLQEQRILFLRQQIKELEELKSQNSFMSDDS